jgi:lipopolysaccharide/colanic/teichoic acid biosynthesis glycosyltransferase
MGESVRPLETPTEDPVLNIWLRAIDVCLAVSALILLCPLLVLIAVAIRLDSVGPVFYRQVRVGLDQRRLGRRGAGRRIEDRGKSPARRLGAPERRQRSRPRGRRVRSIGGAPFLIYKFRTMHTDAERTTGPVWATEDDQRVTRVGRWLRRFRLDELPQFWNVVWGDMSIVGPRPERPSFVERLHREMAAYALRHRVRPGITGLAQVKRGPDQNIDDVRVKLDYDLEYVASRSLRLNLLIMLRTVPVVLRLSWRR